MQITGETGEGPALPSSHPAAVRQQIPCQVSCVHAAADPSQVKLAMVGLRLQVIEEADEGQPFAYVGVFDGHGGIPTSDWLESNFSDFVDQHWDGPQRAVQSITEAFMQVCLAAVWPVQ